MASKFWSIVMDNSFRDFETINDIMLDKLDYL